MIWDVHGNIIDPDKVGIRIITCMDHDYLYELMLVGASRALTQIILKKTKECAWIISAWVKSYRTVNLFIRQTDITPVNMVTCTVMERLHPMRSLYPEHQYITPAPRIPFDGQYLDVVAEIQYIDRKVKDATSGTLPEVIVCLADLDHSTSSNN